MALHRHGVRRGTLASKRKASATGRSRSARGLKTARKSRGRKGRPPRRRLR